MNRRQELIRFFLEEELTEEEQKEIDLLYEQQYEMISESETTISVNDILTAETEVGGSLET